MPAACGPIATFLFRCIFGTIGASSYDLRNQSLLPSALTVNADPAQDASASWFAREEGLRREISRLEDRIRDLEEEKTELVASSSDNTRPLVRCAHKQTSGIFSGLTASSASDRPEMAGIRCRRCLCLPCCLKVGRQLEWRTCRLSCFVLEGRVALYRSTPSDVSIAGCMGMSLHLSSCMCGFQNRCAQKTESSCKQCSCARLWRLRPCLC
jgi:hypothetical protein